MSTNVEIMYIIAAVVIIAILVVGMIGAIRMGCETIIDIADAAYGYLLKKGKKK